jgi:hypothetical protein
VLIRVMRVDRVPVQRKGRSTRITRTNTKHKTVCLELEKPLLPGVGFGSARWSVVKH